MAKANDTAIEQLIKWMAEPSGKAEDVIIEMMAKINELRKVERQQIETAFNNGLHHKERGWHDSQHYYFMEYIDND